jgi:hypothetical protein
MLQAWSLQNRECRFRAGQTSAAKLNRMMTGWRTYFCPGAVSKAYPAIEVTSTRRD